jgi:type I site-specific restriction-modification system R (restriction) subunit
LDSPELPSKRQTRTPKRSSEIISAFTTSSGLSKATVPIYYESRIAKLGLNAAELPKIDDEFEEITEGEEQTSKEKLKTKWAALEAMVGDPKRIGLIAADLVAHWEKRYEAMNGKAMIVCMSRRICVDLYGCADKAEAGVGGGGEGDVVRHSDVESAGAGSRLWKVELRPGSGRFLRSGGGGRRPG